MDPISGLRQGPMGATEVVHQEMTHYPLGHNRPPARLVAGGTAGGQAREAATTAALCDGVRTNNPLRVRLAAAQRPRENHEA